TVGPAGTTTTEQSCQQGSGDGKSPVDEPQKPTSPGTSGHHPASSIGPDHRGGGRPADGRLSQDLLPMGTTRLERDDGAVGTAGAGPAREADRPGERNDDTEDRRAGSPSESSRADGRSAGDPARDGSGGQ